MTAMMSDKIKNKMMNMSSNKILMLGILGLIVFSLLMALVAYGINKISEQENRDMTDTYAYVEITEIEFNDNFWDDTTDITLKDGTHFHLNGIENGFTVGQRYNLWIRNDEDGSTLIKAEMV